MDSIPLEQRQSTLASLTALHAEKKLLRRQIEEVLLALSKSTWSASMEEQLALLPADAAAAAPVQSTACSTAVSAAPPTTAAAATAAAPAEPVAPAARPAARAVPAAPAASAAPASAVMPAVQASARTNAPVPRQEPSPELKIQSIEKARQSLTGPKARGVELLVAAQDAISALGFEAKKRDESTEALRNLATAVNQLKQDAALDAMEPKPQLLEFLRSVVERAPRQRAIVENLLEQLQQRPAWQATEAFQQLLLELCPHLLSEEGDRLKRSRKLREAAQRYKADGHRGAVLVRVAACFDLMNKDAAGHSDPFVRVKVGSNNKPKQTIVINDCLNPTWEAEGASFYFPIDGDELLVEVLDEDFFRKEPLGTLRLPLKDLPSLQELVPDTKRFRLAEVEHGEIELELAVCL